MQLIDGKQLSYGLIYTFSLVKLETLKAYIKIYIKLDLFDHLSLLLRPPSFLIRSLMIVSNYVSII